MKALCILCLAFTAFAQSTPQFDTAVLKISPAGTYGKPYGILIGSQFTARTVTTRSLIAQAWELQENQILGGPDWLNSDRYDLTAKPDMSAGVPSRDDLHLMLRALLAERTGLALHEASRDMPVYSLVVGKDGSKLKVSAVTSPAQKAKTVINGHIGGTGMPVQYLTDMLATVLQRPVNDNTGLTGVYDFQLQWMPDETQRSVGSPAAANADGPSLFQAIQQQLGLRLESKRIPTRVLVIDKIEKPGEN
jgi:uncharacterized protein (TIGR03435 family)